jgi:cellulose synthase/poly-beta-1,6-N-acetylglucosamine synthase-like glycosyltransferase
MKVVALVPAHNEEASIGSTIAALLSQTRPIDQIVVISDNSTDRTFEIACSQPITAIRTVGNAHRKAGALNAGWARFGQDADIILCIDADTILPPTAAADWEQEFKRDSSLGGSSAKLTMLGNEILVRLQRAEFARWTDTGLKRGWTSVLAGTACAIRNDLLRELAKLDGRAGPWAYDSIVEDFELTYRIRGIGHRCHVSPAVRAYTEAMKTPKALWGQRMKWQVGTVEDLLRFGFNKLTRVDWWQQLVGLLASLVRVMWVATMVLAMALGLFRFSPMWLLPTLVFIANDVKQSLRIPHRDKWDVVLAAALLPQEVFAWIRAGWFTASWLSVLRSKVTGRKKDYWSVQYELEDKKPCTVTRERSRQAAAWPSRPPA